MASTEQQLRRELHDEREQLAEAVGTLRSKLRSKVPLVAGGALALGFVASGGIGATARLLMRRGRARD
jgi:sensor histidine kinase regulating citrate/malate metabolism